jgi:ABC-type lipoprotein export system ATPase subunit
MSLALHTVSHRYTDSGRWILYDVSLAIERGSTLAIAGPSGSGKTTLLAILGLLLAPTEGEITIDGESVPRSGAALSFLRSDVFGWVFQTVNVLARRPVIDNAALACLSRGMTRAEASARALSALQSVGLGGMAERAANTLSGGELQRLCIARAIAAGSRFLLADEPTGQLDRSTSDEVVDALLRSRPPETALVLVTHDPLVAARCDSVVSIIDGRVVAPEAIP